MSNANPPFFPPMSPYVLPASPFDQLIANYGVNLLWGQSNQCACVYGGEIPGSPEPDCNTCHGRGVYWNELVGPFAGLITFSTPAPGDREPGAQGDGTWGLIQRAHPMLTIPATAGEPYANASVYDVFVEVDNIVRFSCDLVVSGTTALPYQQNASVAASGAVTVYDTTTKSVVIASDYTVVTDSTTGNAIAVTVSGYAPGTPYTVQYTASPAYIAFGKSGGMAHNRPFGLGNVALPKRFQLELLDLWTRARNAGAGSSSPQAAL